MLVAAKQNKTAHQHTFQYSPLYLKTSKDYLDMNSTYILCTFILFKVKAN